LTVRTVVLAPPVATTVPVSIVDLVGVVAGDAETLPESFVECASVRVVGVVGPAADGFSAPATFVLSGLAAEESPAASGAAEATPCPVMMAAPTPSATANPPTRPMYIAALIDTSYGRRPTIGTVSRPGAIKSVLIEMIGDAIFPRVNFGR
jgi:hypothetical protein